MDLPDPTPSPELLTFVEAEAGTADSFFAMSEPLRARQAAVDAQGDGDVQAGWMMTAFDYDLAWRGRDPKHQPFGSMIEAGGQAYPMAVGNVPDQVADLWAGVFDQTTSPVPRARLGHLLFVKRGGRIGRDTAVAYLELANGNWAGIERIVCFDWALDLATKVKDSALVDQIVEDLVRFADQELNNPDSGPGVTLFAIRLLSDHDKTHPALPSLFAQARHTYQNDTWTKVDVIDLERAVAADAGARAEFNRQEVQTLLDHARAETGMLRAVFLLEAAKRAAHMGVTDLSEQARVELQQLNIDDLGLHTSSVEMNVPSDLVEAHLARIVDRDTLLEAMTEFVSQGAPSGHAAANEAAVEKNMAEHPLLTVFPTVRLTAEGLPQSEATSGEQHKAQQLGDYETRMMMVTGDMLGEALARILTRFNPDVADLAAILPPNPDDPNVQAIARALGHFGKSDFEAAALVAVVRIEAILREQLKADGVAVFKPQTGQTRGQYHQLGSLLSKTDGRIDDSWRRFLITFLTSEWGPNYRNDLLHGFIDRVGRTQATLVLVAALHVLIWAQTTQPEPEGPAASPGQDQTGAE